MKVSNLKFLFVMFGSYSEITPTIDNLKYFVDNMLSKGFMPSTFNEVSFNINEISTNEKRIALKKMDDSFDIKFLTERIEFEAKNLHFDSFITLEENLKLLKNFEKETIEILNIISERFSFKHQRLGLVTNYLLPEDISHSIIESFSKDTPSFKNRNSVEWNQKTLVRQKSNHPSLVNEELNVSREFSFGNRTLIINNLPPQRLNKIMMTIDINTVPENTSPRFANNVVLDFIKSTIKMHDTLITEISTTVK